METVYTLAELQKKKLRGKPKCPYCEKPIGFVYDDLPQGHLGQPCPNCKRKVLLDFSTMTAYKIK